MNIYPPSNVCVILYTKYYYLHMKEFPESRLHSTIKYSSFVAPRLILILENHMCKYFKTPRIPEYVKYLLLLLGVGRVCFSGLGSGYGFWDLARVGSRVSGYWARVNEIWFGSNSGQVFFSFFSQCWLNLAKNSNINRWWSSACKNKWYFEVWPK